MRPKRRNSLEMATPNLSRESDSVGRDRAKEVRMFSVWINGQQREGIDEGWIVRTIQGLRRDGEDVCVRIAVKASGLDLGVSAGACAPSGGGREPTASERRILDLWNACGLQGQTDFPPGQLIQCLKRLERAI